MQEIGPSTSTRQLLYKLFVSAFVSWNLLVISCFNSTDGLTNFFYFFTESFLSAQNYHRLQVAIYYSQRYANLVGLDNRWHMFGHQSRFNWHFLITGVYSDGKRTLDVTLPDPRQIPRNFWQNTFTDFKEGKFHLIMYGSEPGRFAYAYYLARNNRTAQGLPIRQVHYRLITQNILEPEQAYARGYHLDNDIQVRQLNQFPIVLPKE